MRTQCHSYPPHGCHGPPLRPTSWVIPEWGRGGHAMPWQQTNRPADHARQSDDELVERARQAGGGWAEDVLLERHARLISRVALGEARARGLARRDRPDALQVGRWALREAIARYRPPSGDRPPGHFARFLRRVVVCRVCDLARRVRDHERHYCRSVRVGSRPSSAGPADGLGGQADFEPAAADGDPARLAEQGEIVGRVRRALSRLTPLERRLAESLLDPSPLHVLARRLGLPYGVVKRLRQRVRADLQDRLRGLAD